MRIRNRLELTAARGRAKTLVMVLVLALMAVTLLARSAFAQEADAVKEFDLVGQVLGENSQPLVGAFVSLKGSDWGSLSDETGKFVVRHVVPGRIELVVEQLGYETLEWTGFVTPATALELRLEPQPILLEGLTVVADRFESRRRATASPVRWFDRSTLATTPQDNTLEFLSARGLTRIWCRSDFGDDCVLVRGRAVVPSVWVDEAPVLGGLDYLSVIRPHELYMVEVYASGRHIRAYTNEFMARSAEVGLRPIPFVF